MGGCCIRLKKLEDAVLDVITEAIRRTPAKAHVDNYDKSSRERAAALTAGS